MGAKRSGLILKSTWVVSEFWRVREFAQASAMARRKNPPQNAAISIRMFILSFSFLTEHQACRCVYSQYRQGFRELKGANPSARQCSGDKKYQGTNGGMHPAHIGAKGQNGASTRFSRSSTTCSSAFHLCVQEGADAVRRWLRVFC